MFVVATAGHVDHGKSRLVHALTGMEPDRWAEERRRGLTIDLGFAWTTLPSGADVAFVDVPGHQRFLGNMLAGLGAAPVVMFVVAADQGWQAQSDDHRDAIAALGIDRGVIVITRSDLAAEDRITQTVTDTLTGLSSTGLATAPVVITSAATGTGLDELRAELDIVLAESPSPSPTAPVRFWVDRSFTIGGSGTVVTGTLSAGTIHIGDRLELSTANRTRTVTVRGLQSEGRPRNEIGPTRRTAVNLRGVHTDDVARGDVLLTPDAWRDTAVVDIARVSGHDFTSAPEHLVVHIGTSAQPARLRPFDTHHARLNLHHALPLIVGDRMVLRDPGTRIVGGARILDADPPDLRRRGDGTRRATLLASMQSTPSVEAEVSRRGVVRVDHLRRLGLIGGSDPSDDPPPESVRAIGGWWADATALADWARRLRTAVDATHREDPLSPGLSRASVPTLLGIPDDAAIVDAVIGEAGVDHLDGHLAARGRTAHLGPAEDAVAALERRLAADPFAAPEADDLAALGLGDRELAAAERARRLQRLGAGVVLAPTAPALAMRTLATLEQPFTTSAARRALHTTRRVVIPLLEHLDARGWTRRIDAGHREVIR
ncbi:selenocysteine-specific translation elongation factor [Gordonia sp. VNK1]|uniref:selenocysteine-specific translation elongation factor n=1 Tax=Gordonia oleivorans TaxID=3156618 RepID=UPI0032B5825E